MAGRSGSAGAPQRVNVHEFAGKELVAEVPIEDLRYKMIMALNAADIGNPSCEPTAQICAESLSSTARNCTSPRPRTSSRLGSAQRANPCRRAPERPRRMAGPQERR